MKQIVLYGAGQKSPPVRMLYALAAILSELGNKNNIISHKHCDVYILISAKNELLLLEEKPMH